ncbi:hypothetical protein IC006_0156 [Sulfuracidifex tepidarius]|uniref:Uncharacterized protein n=1 Tax=Sulfuracidifex tepidarius TaxID=1294262 RepID=A0A510DRS9_9CREN|nr:hypothetical protein [Sulfuracidifex tepidarius]BBG22872.1 hypothetical protein IC006_0156 [Sulfuracidifex tepidarius]
MDKETVLQLIKDTYHKEGKPVSLSRLKKRLGIRDSSELLKALAELKNENKVSEKTSGSGRSFSPVMTERADDVIKTLMNEVKSLKEEVRELKESKAKVDYASFDEAYQRISDSLGYASLERIRIELGMSKEDFYSKFRRHIEENYEMIAGGDDGYVRKGVLFGIIKRKKGEKK